jgi:hypothetical protein
MGSSLTGRKHVADVLKKSNVLLVFYILQNSSVQIKNLHNDNKFIGIFHPST